MSSFNFLFTITSDANGFQAPLPAISEIPLSPITIPATYQASFVAQRNLPPINFGTSDGSFQATLPATSEIPLRHSTPFPTMENTSVVIVSAIN